MHSVFKIIHHRIRGDYDTILCPYDPNQMVQKETENDYLIINSPERGRTADAGSKGRHVAATPQGYNFIRGIFCFI